MKQMKNRTSRMLCCFAWLTLVSLCLSGCSMGTFGAKSTSDLPTIQLSSAFEGDTLSFKDFPWMSTKEDVFTALAITDKDAEEFALDENTVAYRTPIYLKDLESELDAVFIFVKNTGIADTALMHVRLCKEVPALDDVEYVDYMGACMELIPTLAKKNEIFASMLDETGEVGSDISQVTSALAYERDGKNWNDTFYMEEQDMRDWETELLADVPEEQQASTRAFMEEQIALSVECGVTLNFVTQPARVVGLG